MAKPIIRLNPMRLFGNWKFGWALDYHTISSRYDKAAGFFKTDRTDLGEALYKLKYKKHWWRIGAIARTAACFLRQQEIANYIDIIVTVPPANFRLFIQPVRSIGKRVGKLLDIKVLTRELRRTKNSPPLKSIEDRAERSEAVKGLYSARSIKLEGKTVLLLDDLYRSGATLREAARALKSDGKADAIYALTITKTRVKR